MKNKILGRLVFIFIFLIIMSICYAQNEQTAIHQDSQHKPGPPKLVEPSVDGIYQLPAATIKFFPPKGWKKIDMNTLYPPLTVDFMYSKDVKAGGPVLGILAMTLSSEPAEFMEQIRGTDGTLAYGNQLLKEEDITFLDTKAYSCITINTNKVKQKTIVFIKANKAYQISFTAKEVEGFDNLLPIVDESLKTFEIISSVPK